jgi:large subunit ribosomal protein L30e
MTVMTVEKDIRQAMKDRKMLIGSRSVIRAMKNKGLQEVVMAQNCPPGTADDIGRYAELNRVKMTRFEGSSVRLGQMCGKPFAVLLVGISK